MALQNAFADLALDATVSERFGGGKTAATATVTAMGDTQLVAAPGIGSRIKLYWVSAIVDPDQTTSPIITIHSSSGTEYYRVFAVAHWEPFTLPDNDSLLINLEHASEVVVTVHYKIV